MDFLDFWTTVLISLSFVVMVLSIGHRAILVSGFFSFLSFFLSFLLSFSFLFHQCHYGYELDLGEAWLRESSHQSRRMFDGMGSGLCLFIHPLEHPQGFFSSYSLFPVSDFSFCPQRSP